MNGVQDTKERGIQRLWMIPYLPETLRQVYAVHIIIMHDMQRGYRLPDAAYSSQRPVKIVESSVILNVPTYSAFLVLALIRALNRSYWPDFGESFRRILMIGSGTCIKVIRCCCGSDMRCTRTAVVPRRR